MQIFKDCIAGILSASCTSLLVAPFQINYYLRFGLNPYINVDYLKYEASQGVYNNLAIPLFWKKQKLRFQIFIYIQTLTYCVKDFLNRMTLPKNSIQNTYQYLLQLFLNGGIAGSLGYLIQFPTHESLEMLIKDISDVVFWGRHNKELKYRWKGFYECLTTNILNQGFSLNSSLNLKIGLFTSFIQYSIFFGGYEIGKNKYFGDKQAQKETSIFSKILLSEVIVLVGKFASQPFQSIYYTYKLNNKQQLKLIEIVIQQLKKGHSGLFWFPHFHFSQTLILVFYDEFQRLYE